MHVKKADCSTMCAKQLSSQNIQHSDPQMLGLYSEAINIVTTPLDEILSSIHRGYYTVVRSYEFYVRVARIISHE